ncbi:anaphase-promoting complex subunit Hcn1 [Irineochytrium annulatum]|nr:anaphase-promoting complex subunit Hcn1 [Irineochytrium annulatum]
MVNLTQTAVDDIVRDLLEVQTQYTEGLNKIERVLKVLSATGHRYVGFNDTEIPEEGEEEIEEDTFGVRWEEEDYVRDSQAIAPSSAPTFVDDDALEAGRDVFGNTKLSSIRYSSTNLTSTRNFSSIRASLPGLHAAVTSDMEQGHGGLPFHRQTPKRPPASSMVSLSDRKEDRAGPPTAGSSTELRKSSTLTRKGSMRIEKQLPKILSTASLVDTPPSPHHAVAGECAPGAPAASHAADHAQLTHLHVASPPTRRPVEMRKRAASDNTAFTHLPHPASLYPKPKPASAQAAPPAFHHHAAHLASTAGSLGSCHVGQSIASIHIASGGPASPSSLHPGCALKSNEKSTLLDRARTQSAFSLRSTTSWGGYKAVDAALRRGGRYTAMVFGPRLRVWGSSSADDDYWKGVREAGVIWRIHYSSLFSAYWEIFMVLAYTMLVGTITITIAHDIGKMVGPVSIIVAVVFAADIIINLLTPTHEFVKEGGYTDAVMLTWMRAYSRKYLLVDLISTIPLELFVTNPSIRLHLLLFKLIRSHRLFKTIFASRILLNIRLDFCRRLGIGQAFSGIFNIMLVLLAYVHIQSCLLFYVGRMTGFVNWTSIPPWDGALKDIMEESVLQRYTWSLYQAVGNMFPMQFKPFTVIEQWTVSVMIIFGAVLYAIFVGTISAVAVGLDPSGRLYHQKMDELIEYLNWKKIGQPTREKVLEYYQVKYRGKFFEERSLLNDMNDALKREIAMHNCKNLIEKVPFLRRSANDGLDEIFLGRIASALIPTYYVLGDNVVRQGETEVALISNVPRTATVEAAAPCILYRLTQADFKTIIADFPDIRDRVHRLSEARKVKVHASGSTVKLNSGQSGTSGCQGSTGGVAKVVVGEGAHAGMLPHQDVTKNQADEGEE